jgi:hypothetical protein
MLRATGCGTIEKRIGRRKSRGFFAKVWGGDGTGAALSKVRVERVK